jgi:hypothetical protein
MIPPVFMSVNELRQVDSYYATLLRTMSTNIGEGIEQGQPPTGGASGSGNDQERAGTRNVDEPADGEGQVGGKGNNTGGTDVGSFVGQGRAVGDFSTDDFAILEIESVEEDAQDADATMKDELIMLANSGDMWSREIWREELAKYLQAEQKEREEMQENREAMLKGWLQGI